MCHNATHHGLWVRRRYHSTAERIGWLEAYAEELENELAGVRERIAWLAGDEVTEADGEDA